MLGRSHRCYHDSFRDWPIFFRWYSLTKPWRGIKGNVAWIYEYFWDTLYVYCEDDKFVWRKIFAKFIYTRCSFTFEWNHSVRKLKSVLARIFVCAKLVLAALVALNTSHKTIHVARGTFCIHASLLCWAKSRRIEILERFLFCSLIVSLKMWPLCNFEIL